MSGANNGNMIMRRKFMMGDFASGEFFRTTEAGSIESALPPEGGDKGVGRGGSPRWNSGEHSVIPGNVLKFDSGNQPIVSYKISFANGLELTYGQLIALSGDFYAWYRKPISNQQTDGHKCEVAMACFECLTAKPESFSEANNIVAIMGEEILAYQSGLLRGIPPSIAFKAMSVDEYFDRQYNSATGGGDGTLWYGEPGRYLKLASTNWDHFGEHAWVAYTTFHSLAMGMAKEAKTDDELAQAYAMNAFGEHYLTDMFSSGHVRTPRQEFYSDFMSKFSGDVSTVEELPEYSTSNVQLNVSGLLAKNMHDEDNLNGLWVKNERGDVWLAYGDDRYRDMQNYANVVMLKHVLAKSLEQVWQAHVTGEVQDVNEVGQYVPSVCDKNEHGCPNYSPLFIPGHTKYLGKKRVKVQVRDDVHNLLDYNWDMYAWSEGSTYNDTKTPKKGPSLFPAGGARRDGTPSGSGVMAISGQDLCLSETVINYVEEQFKDVDRGDAPATPPANTPLPVPTSALAPLSLVGALPPMVAIASHANNSAAVATWCDGGALAVSTLQQKHWQDFKEICGGAVYSAPALVGLPGKGYFAYYLDSIGELKQAELTTGKVTSIGMGVNNVLFTGAPTAIASGDDVHVFAVDMAGRIEEKSYVSNSWGYWQVVGSGFEKFFGSPSIYVDPESTLHICAVTSTGQLAWTQKKNNGGWEPWQIIEDDEGNNDLQALRETNSRVSITGWGANNVYLFSRSFDDGETIWYRHWDGKKWSTKHTISNRSFISAPTAIALANDHVEVFGVSWDNRVYRASLVNGQWVGNGDLWTPVGDVFAISQVIAASTVTKSVTLVVIDRAFKLSSTELQFDAHGVLKETSLSWSQFGNDLSS